MPWRQVPDGFARLAAKMVVLRFRGATTTTQLNISSTAPVRLPMRLNQRLNLMKKLTISLCLLTAAAFLNLHAAETPIAGDKAPAFTGKNQDGKSVQLADFTGKKAVLLYFYPKDNTPGCTKEACALRDRMGDLKKNNVEVIGVSFDSAESHKKFIADQKLNFTLLADTDAKITDAYNAHMLGKPLARRISFLIDKEGKITHVTDHPNPDRHLSEMKDAVAQLKK